MDVEQEFSIDDATNAFLEDDGEDLDDENTPVDDEDEEDPDDEGVEEDPDDDEDGEEEEDPEEDDEQGDEEDPDDDEEGEDGEDEEPSVADPESVVSVEVDGETQNVKVSELQRLAGQEKSLTQKSQAVANQRRTLDAQGLAISNILEQRYNAAKEKADQYKDVDLFRASRELDDDDFDSLRKAKEAADAELSQIENESKDFMNQARESRNNFLREQAKRALPVIQEAIPDWSDGLYNSVRSYAVKQGMDQASVDEIVDPAAIIMMHKAMKHDDAATKGKDNVTKKVRKAPKRVSKKSKAPTDKKADAAKKARRKAMESGDVDAITELFLADSTDE